MIKTLDSALGLALVDELTSAFGQIRHCVDQLDDEQVWHRPEGDRNAVGNLLLHLAGNLRQYIVSGLGGAADIRDRPAEFSARGPTPGKRELLGMFETVFADCRAALEKQTADDWQRIRTVQNMPHTGLSAAIRSVAHCRGHAQEIIHMTRGMLGERYRFAGRGATAK